MRRLERVRRSLGEGGPPLDGSYGWQGGLQDVLRLFARVAQSPESTLCRAHARSEDTAARS